MNSEETRTVNLVAYFKALTNANEELMTAMAIKETGNYYFVETAIDIPGIFEEELNGVQSLVSKNTTLAITFPEAVELRQVHHYNYTLEGNQISFKLNDVFSATQKFWS